jgi:hypothetical protein
MSSLEDALQSLCGDPAAAKAVKLGEAAVRRAQRLDERTQGPAGLTLSDLATGVALCLRKGDTPGARKLIDAGAQLFGQERLIAAVGLRSRELEAASLQRMQAMQDAQSRLTRAQPPMPDVEVDRRPLQPVPLYYEYPELAGEAPYSAEDYEVDAG